MNGGFFSPFSPSLVSVSDQFYLLRRNRFDGFRSLEFKKLASGRLVGDLGERLKEKVEGKSELKFAVYAAHDTTLAGILLVPCSFSLQFVN